MLAGEQLCSLPFLGSASTADKLQLLSFHRILKCIHRLKLCCSYSRFLISTVLLSFLICAVLFFQFHYFF